MTIRKLLPLMFVTVASAALLPERASAQCWSCDRCWLGPTGTTCVLTIPFPLMGFTDCLQTAQCYCQTRVEDFDFCYSPGDAETAEYSAELAETLVAIRTNGSIPADGRFFFTRRGAEFVVRRKCDIAEVGRVAITEVEPVPVLGAG